MRKVISRSTEKDLEDSQISMQDLKINDIERRQNHVRRPSPHTLRKSSTIIHRYSPLAIYDAMLRIQQPGWQFLKIS